MRWMFHAMKTDAVKYGAVIYMPWMFHAMKTDAVKYAAFIYMLWFTMPWKLMLSNMVPWFTCCGLHADVYMRLIPAPLWHNYIPLSLKSSLHISIRIIECLKSTVCPSNRLHVNRFKWGRRCLKTMISSLPFVMCETNNRCTHWVGELIRFKVISQSNIIINSAHVFMASSLK